MDCKYVAARFDDFLDKVLPDHEVEAVQVHLSYCAGCRQHFHELRALTGHLASLPSISAPPYLKNLVMGRVERRYRLPWRAKLQALVNELLHPLRMLESRDITIGLISLPIALTFFLAIFVHMQTSILNAEQVSMLTYTAKAIPPGLTSSLDAATEEASDGLTPVGISSPHLVRFVESASENQPKGDSFWVMVYVTQEGDGIIEQVIEHPLDSAILKKLSSLISSVKFRPAMLNGKRVDSYFILAFNQVCVLG